MISVIQDYLMANGIPSNISGFKYLTMAIKMYSPGKKFVSEIYKGVAEYYDSTPMRVERCIRHAISKSYCNLTNSEYIALARMLIDRKI